MTKKVKRYAKFWTTMLSDEWFLGLNNSHRGIFMQLILNCKNQDDDGYVGWTTLTTAAGVMGTERRTLAYFLDNNANELSVLCKKPLNIELLHYVEWQEHRAKNEEIKKPKKTPTKLNQTKLNQTITKAELKLTPIERFDNWLKVNHETVSEMGRVAKPDEDFMAVESWLKLLVRKMRVWVISHPAEVKNRKHWLKMVNTFIGNDISNKEPSKLQETGMTLRQEQEHFADKERLGSRSEFKPIGEVLSDE